MASISGLFSDYVQMKKVYIEFSVLGIMRTIHFLL